MSSRKSQSRRGDHTSPKADAPGLIRCPVCNEYRNSSEPRCLDQTCPARYATKASVARELAAQQASRTFVPGTYVPNGLPIKPATPQPAKAAQENDSKPHWQQWQETATRAQAELERVKGQLANAQDVDRTNRRVEAGLRRINDELLAALKQVLPHLSSLDYDAAKAAIASTEGRAQS